MCREIWGHTGRPPSPFSLSGPSPFCLANRIRGPSPHARLPFFAPNFIFPQGPPPRPLGIPETTGFLPVAPPRAEKKRKNKKKKKKIPSPGIPLAFGTPVHITVILFGLGNPNPGRKLLPFAAGGRGRPRGGSGKKPATYPNLVVCRRARSFEFPFSLPSTRSQWNNPYAPCIKRESGQTVDFVGGLCPLLWGTHAPTR